MGMMVLCFQATLDSVICGSGIVMPFGMHVCSLAPLISKIQHVRQVGKTQDLCLTVVYRLAML